MSKYESKGRIDVTKLRIVDETYSDGRASPESKFEPIFSQLAIGKRLACEPNDANRISAALKKWLERKGRKNPIVKSRARCEDGMGGVWWLGHKAQEKPKTKLVGVNPFSQLDKKAA